MIKRKLDRDIDGIIGMLPDMSPEVSATLKSTKDRVISSFKSPPAGKPEAAKKEAAALVQFWQDVADALAIADLRSDYRAALLDFVMRNGRALYILIDHWRQNDQMSDAVGMLEFIQELHRKPEALFEQIDKLAELCAVERRANDRFVRHHFTSDPAKTAKLLADRPTSTGLDDDTADSKQEQLLSLREKMIWAIDSANLPRKQAQYAAKLRCALVGGKGSKWGGLLDYIHQDKNGWHFNVAGLLRFFNSNGVPGTRRDTLDRMFGELRAIMAVVKIKVEVAR